MPPTSCFCSWGAGSKKKYCSVTGGIGAVTFLVPELHNTEKSFRWAHESRAEGAHYETLLAADKVLFDQEMKPERMREFCAGLQADRRDGRPCKAAVRWLDADEDGLLDVRGLPHLWATATEQKGHAELSTKKPRLSAIEVSESLWTPEGSNGDRGV